MKSKAEVMYSTMKPWNLFFVVALPGMISMFAMSIYSIFEGVFIGKILGEGAFAAVNIAMPLVMINFSLADLVGVGSSVPISIALGKGEHEKANNIFSCSLMLILAASVFMGCVMFFAAEPLSRMMGADDVLLDTSVRYLRVFAVFGPLSTVFFAMDNFLRISGFVKTSMVINICVNAMMFGFLLLFLLVFKMDVVGSAMSVCISMCACSVFALIPFLAKKTLLKFVKPKFSVAMVKEIAACGSPVFLSNVSGRVTSILINISLMTLGVKMFGAGGGTTAVAAYAVLMYAGELCQPLIYGMSDALSPAIGFNWGAGNYRRVKKLASCVFIGTCLVGIISTLVLFFFSNPVVSLFAKADDVRLIELSAHAIKLFCTAHLFRWIAMSAQSFLSAIEKPVLATVLAVAVAFVFPVIILGSLWSFGLDGIWLNTTGTAVLSAVLAIILMRRVGKEIKRKEKEEI